MNGTVVLGSAERLHGWCSTAEPYQVRGLDDRHIPAMRVPADSVVLRAAARDDLTYSRRLATVWSI